MMKAYFPNLIAKKDVTLITPTNATQPQIQLSQAQVMQHRYADLNNSNSGKSKGRKFVKQSRSQHGSSNSTAGTGLNPSSNNTMKYVNRAGGEIVMPADYVTNSQMGIETNG